MFPVDKRKEKQNKQHSIGTTQWYHNIASFPHERIVDCCVYIYEQMRKNQCQLSIVQNAKQSTYIQQNGGED